MARRSSSPCAPSLPDRSDRVNDVTGRQTVALRQPRLAGRAASENAAFGEELGSARPMNCTVDTAAAEQRRVCSVNGGSDGEMRDVAGFEGDAVRAGHDRFALMLSPEEE